MEGFLLIDIGTGSTRVRLSSLTGEVIADDSFINEPLLDRSRTDRERWDAFYREFMDSVEKLIHENPRIAVQSMAIDSARQSFAGIDLDGQISTLFLNTDNASKEVVDRIRDTTKLDFFKITGKPLTEDFLAPKLVERKENRGLEDLDGVVGFAEALAGKLTGHFVCEASQMTESLLYDVRNQCLSEEILDALDIPRRLFPMMRKSGERIGTVSSEICVTLGIPPFDVILAGADTQVGLTALALPVGEIAIIAGTTSPIVYRTDCFDVEAYSGFWIDADTDGEHLFVESNPGIAGLNYQRYKNAFLPHRTYEEIEENAEERVGKVTAFLTSQGTKDHQTDPKGAFFTKAPLGADIGPEDFAVAILADHAASLSEAFHRLARSTKHKGPIWIAGGSFRSRALTQWVSDLTGRELIRIEGMDELTLRGLLAICQKQRGVFPKKLEITECIVPREDSAILRERSRRAALQEKMRKEKTV